MNISLEAGVRKDDMTLRVCHPTSTDKLKKYFKKDLQKDRRINQNTRDGLPFSGILEEGPGSPGGSKLSNKRFTLFRSSISSRRRYFT